MSNNDNSSAETSGRARRGSFTQQTFNSIFGGRSNSTAGAPTAPFPSAISTGGTTQEQRRRMSISTLGLSGTSPTNTALFPFGARRGSVSTAASESFDENAIDDDDSPGRSAPTTPFTRRMSFGAQALRRGQPPTGSSPNSNGRNPSYTTTKPSLPTIPSGPRSSSVVGGGEAISAIPPKSQSQASTQSKPRTASDYPVSARPDQGGGFNWSEQLRSRAESSVSQSQRPNFSSAAKPLHERTKSVNEMPSPPSVVPAAAPAAPQRPARKQPDAFQERILKGDFYMD